MYRFTYLGRVREKVKVFQVFLKCYNLSPCKPRSTATRSVYQCAGNRAPPHIWNSLWKCRYETMSKNHRHVCTCPLLLAFIERTLSFQKETWESTTSKEDFSPNTSSCCSAALSVPAGTLAAALPGCPKTMRFQSAQMVLNTKGDLSCTFVKCLGFFLLYA